MPTHGYGRRGAPRECRSVLRKQLLGEDPTTEADSDRMGTGTGLELREQVPHVRLHGFLGEEQHLPDLTVDEPLGDEAEHLDLPRRGLLLELSKGGRERDDLGALAATPRRSSVEPPRVIGVPVQDLIPFHRVHEWRIGRGRASL